MAEAYFRFYARLNNFLVRDFRGRTVPYPVFSSVTIKHAIEALGVPHTDVDLILVNGQSVGFSHKLRDRDQAAVFPPFTGLDISAIQQLRPPLEPPLCFIVDSHLGQLATYLRLLGFDTLYRNDYEDAELAKLAFQQERILLTRDRRLLMRKQIIYGYCLQTRDPQQQLDDVLYRYRLGKEIRPWRRCLRCSGLLSPIPKEDVLDRLEPKTRLYYDEFHICQNCQRIYWKGSHYQPLRRFVEQTLARLQNKEE